MSIVNRLLLLPKIILVNKLIEEYKYAQAHLKSVLDIRN